MMFNSFGFIIFFLLVCLILILTNFIYKLNNNNTRKIILLISSYIFYCLFDYRLFVVLLFVNLFTYFVGKSIYNNKKVLVFGVVIDVILLAIFKYFNFFVDTFIKLFSITNAEVIHILLPVGISFYIFKSISYLVDVYRGKNEYEKDYIDLSLYISFFPELVAGPISRSSDLIKQFKEDRKITKDSFSDGLQIFLVGLFKKIVIADNISVFVNEVYRAPNIYSSLTILLCVVAYSIEIYMDFSGYSDMAIGVAKILGYDIKKNFNLPYVSRNVTEFWKRWHISLSSWLQDYIYIPLGGNRKGIKRQYLNLLITMAIGGLWHGANWTFVLWGIVNGIALIIHKIYSRNRNKEGGVLSVLLTFIFISLTWVLFKGDSLSNSINVYERLFSFSSGIDFISTWAIFGIIVVFFGTIIAYKKNNKESYYPLQDLRTVKGLFILFLFIGIIIGLAYTGSNPFIYAAF